MMIRRMLIGMFGLLGSFTPILSADYGREEGFIPAAEDAKGILRVADSEEEDPGFAGDPCSPCVPTYNPCAPACNPCGPCAFRLNAELLYWRPELCGLEGAFGNTTIATTVNDQAITTTTVTESDHEPHFKWNAGFRVGAGVTFNCLDIKLDWTHFNGHAKFRENTQHGRWDLKYDTIDLLFGRYFCAGSCFYVLPFIGVRGLEIHNKLKSHLETLFTSPLIGNNTVFTDKNDKEHFWGVAPQIGLKADWYLGCNLSLYGSFAILSYYGHVKGRNFDSDTFTHTVSVCNGKKKHCFNNLATDAAIGLRWDSCSTCYCGCNMNFMIKLGLEQHRIYDFSSLGSDGTLGLDGGVFGVGVRFSY